MAATPLAFPFFGATTSTTVFTVSTFPAASEALPTTVATAVTFPATSGGVYIAQIEIYTQK